MRFQANPKPLHEMISAGGPLRITITKDQHSLEEMLEGVSDLLFELDWDEFESEDVECIYAEIFPEHDVFLVADPVAGSDNLRLRINGHKFELDLTFSPTEIANADPDDKEFGVIER